jgi:hypothetical protein
MNVRSSISSSDTAAQRLPHLPWTLLLGCALALAAALVLAMETALAVRGFRSTIVDSQTQWNKQRRRAAELGKHALILVGDSRMQTDLDLDFMRAHSGLEPVELAVAGSSFMPVFAGLARDADITGTILVAFSEVEVTRWNSASESMRYEADYEKQPHSSGLPDYRASEALLEYRLHAGLTSYADGATPLNTLLTRILDADATPQYIVTLPDRSRMVDFSHANLRSLNYRSAIFELEGDIPGSYKTEALPGLERALRERIDALNPADVAAHAVQSAEIETAAQSIQKRGGHVIFVVLPTSGYITDIVHRTYPRALFWDRFCKKTSAQCMHFADREDLRRFVPPDGLHLDQSDRSGFTAALIGALGLGKGSAPTEK